MRREILVGVLSLLLAGCAASNGGRQWVKAGAVQSDFDRDKAQCLYEAKLHTQPGYMGPAYSMSTALSHGIAEGITDGLRMSDLFKSCMEAKGWSVK
jgi:hypothetical protein